MTYGKINRKYFALIWVALVLAYLMFGVYDIYSYVTQISDVTRLTVIIAILRSLFFDGIIPAVFVFVYSLIVYRIGYSRYVRCISRNDFCYTIMAVTAVVKFFVGIIQAFAILEPNVQVFTGYLLDFALMTGAMIATFFFIFAKQYRFNPVEKRNAFGMWMTVYMVFAGLGVIGQSGIVLILSDGSELANSLLTLLYYNGYDIYVNDFSIAVSITAICIYVAYLVLVIVLGEKMRKDAEKFRNPETRGDYYAQYDNRAYTVRNDSDRVFGSDGLDYAQGQQLPKQDEHVFDEFDL